LLAPSLPLGATPVPLQLLMTPNEQKSGHEKSGTKPKKKKTLSLFVPQKKKQRKQENPCVCLSLQRFCKRMSLSAWHFSLNDVWSWNPKAAFTARSSASKKKEHVFGIFQLK